MAARSAGILLYKQSGEGILVLLAHPGGPFWARRDEGAWSIPKGEIGPGEAAEDAARRELEEELGVAPRGALEPLGSIRQASGKTVEAFALESDLDASAIRSNTFEIEWPPRSGRLREFPEIDRVEWMPLSLARAKILAAQRALLDRLEAKIAERDAR